MTEYKHIFLGRGAIETTINYESVDRFNEQRAKMLKKAIERSQQTAALKLIFIGPTK